MSTNPEQTFKETVGAKLRKYGGLPPKLPEPSVEDFKAYLQAEASRSTTPSGYGDKHVAPAKVELDIRLAHAAQKERDRGE